MVIKRILEGSTFRQDIVQIFYSFDLGWRWELASLEAWKLPAPCTKSVLDMPMLR